MNETKTPDPLVKIGDAEREIVTHFDPASKPSRNTIIGWIDDGTLRGKQIGTTYYVYRSSLKKFLHDLGDVENLTT